jgi:hypothetical protein
MADPIPQVKKQNIRSQDVSLEDEKGKKAVLRPGKACDCPPSLWFYDGWEKKARFLQVGDT